MTEHDRELQEARGRATEALEKAEKTRHLLQRLAEGWTTSREDNNFRSLIRDLGAKKA